MGTEAVVVAEVVVVVGAEAVALVAAGAVRP
jgi:hypothetical protein